MFCSNCGTELPEEETLCPACGEAVETNASVDDLLADVKESFQLEESVEEAEEASAEEAAEETPEEEETTYTAPVEEPEEKKPKKEKKKAGKAVRVLTLIFAILLVLSAAGGFLYLAYATYTTAAECLAVKDYEQAEELFSRFPFFMDSGEQAEQLASLQKAYDEAAALVQQQSYNEALKGYAALGDYRDSQQLLSVLVPYQQATYLMENAAEANDAALLQLPGYDEASTELTEVQLYKGAAELFASTTDYEDSAKLSSFCYTRLASVYMTNSRFKEALACHEFLNAADLQESVTEYLTYCEDEALLSDLRSAILERRDAEAAKEKTDLELVTIELDRLTKYAEDGLMYYDTQLKTQIADYIAGLETEASSVDEAGNCKDVITWYTGSAARGTVIEQLIETYDLLGDDPALQAEYANMSAYYQAAIIVEGAVAKQLVGTTAQGSKEDGDYLTFENTTGYDFSLSVRNEFFTEDGTSVFLHQTEPIPVPKDATVKLPVLFPEEDGWTSWRTAWEYKIQLP